MYAHRGMLEACEKDAEQAYVLLNDGLAAMEQLGDTSLNYWANDYKLSLFNLAIHQVYTGDEINEPAYSRGWFKRMNRIMELMPRIMRFDTFHWIDYHRNKLALRDALSATESGIEDAIFLSTASCMYTSSVLRTLTTGWVMPKKPFVFLNRPKQ